MLSLERSNDKMLGGVCAGLAKSVKINPILLRVLTVMAVLFTGLFIGGAIILAYLLGWIIIPNEQKPKTLESHNKGSIQEEIEENNSEMITEIPDEYTQEEIGKDDSAYSAEITSGVKKLLIIGTFGLIGCVAGGAIGFSMVGSSAGNVFIPILGIIGLIIGGVLGIIVAFTIKP